MNAVLAYLRDVNGWWLTDTSSRYPRALYQIDKPGHCLLITLAITALSRWALALVAWSTRHVHDRTLEWLAGAHVQPMAVAIIVVLAYWSADWWLPSADHVHHSDHPFTHGLSKLVVCLLAPVLLVAQDQPLWLLAWLVAYAPVILLKL